jgi:ribonuclease-3
MVTEARRDIHELAVQRGITRTNIEAILNKFKGSDAPPLRISDLDEYITTFTHKSTLRDYIATHGSNERLELMGDSVLSLVVTKYIYDKYPTCDEGFITRIRTKLVCGTSLSAWALALGLQRHLMMNKKALDQEWNLNPSKLEDTFEALLGALFVDKGIAACRDFIYPLLDAMDFDEVEKDLNYKDVLMRHMQAVWSNTIAADGISRPQSEFMPLYTVAAANGPDHQRIFHVNVSIGGVFMGMGSDTKKRFAEQESARMALIHITRNGTLPVFSSKQSMYLPHIGERCRS